MEKAKVVHLRKQEKIEMRRANAEQWQRDRARREQRKAKRIQRAGMTVMGLALLKAGLIQC